MKKLSQFLRFDFDEFSKGKIYQVVSIVPWVDHNTKTHIGTKNEIKIVHNHQ